MAAIGLFSGRDLAEHRIAVLDPLQTTYRGWTVLEQPPVSQGLIVLIALNILEGLDPPSDPFPGRGAQAGTYRAAQPCG